MWHSKMEIVQNCVWLSVWWKMKWRTTSGRRVKFEMKVGHKSNFTLRMTWGWCKPEINVATTRYSGVIRDKFKVRRAESAVTTLTLIDIWDWKSVR